VLRILLTRALATVDEFEGHGAEGVDDAIERLQADPFAMVISDIHMPEKDGLMLLNWIAAMQPHIKVVMMTGCDDEEQIAEAERLGAYRFVTKPFRDINALVHMVQDALAE